MIDVRIEEFILSAALINKSALAAVAVLPPDVFTSGHRIDIHSSIREQFESGATPSVISVYSSLNKQTADELVAITAREPSSIGWESAVERALNLRTTRRVHYSADMVKDLLHHQGADAAIEFARSELVDTYRSAADTMNPISAIGEQVLNGIEHIKFGIEELDAETFGIPVKYCVTIGARPSVGKTALAISLAANWARAGVGVHYFSCEMPTEMLAKRIISAWSGVDGAALRTGRLTEEDRIRAAGARDRMQRTLGKLYIDDKSKQYAKIFSEAHKAVHLRGCRIIIADHMGLIRAMPKRERRDLQIGDYMARCAEFAKANNCIWINLSQLTRGSEGEKPTLADLRESGSVEQDSDMVVLLHRDRAANSQILEVNIAKFRDGKVIDRNVRFNTSTMEIGEPYHFASKFGETVRP